MKRVAANNEFKFTTKVFRGFTHEKEALVRCRVFLDRSVLYFDSGQYLEGSLDLRLKRFVERGGESGPAIVSSKPSDSLMLARLKTGEMPPQGTPRPAELETVVQYLTEEFDQADRNLKPAPGRVTARRLNRQPLIWLTISP